MSNTEVIEPAFQSQRFSCPVCGELHDQVWLNLYAEQVSNPAGVPLRIEGAGLEMLKKNSQFPPEVLEQKVAYWNKVNSGEVFLDRWASVTTDLFVAGMGLSVCRGCMAVQIWAGGELVQR